MESDRKRKDKTNEPEQSIGKAISGWYHRLKSKWNKLIEQPPTTVEKQISMCEIFRRRVVDHVLDLGHGMADYGQFDQLLKAVSLQSIQIIYMHCNSNEKISMRLFDLPFLNLRQLYLSNSLISSIQPLTHSSMPQLKSLQLDDNQIRDLQPFRHIDTSELKSLNLDRNKIRHLQPLLWCDFRNLQLLSLQYNLIDDIHCLLYLDCQYYEKIRNATKGQDFSHYQGYLLVKTSANPVSDKVTSIAAYPFNLDKRNHLYEHTNLD